MRQGRRRIVVTVATLALIVAFAVIATGTLAAPLKSRPAPARDTPTGGTAQLFGKVTDYQPGKSITIDPQVNGKAAATFRLDAHTIIEQLREGHQKADVHRGESVTVRALRAPGGTGYIARSIAVQPPETAERGYSTFKTGTPNPNRHPATPTRAVTPRATATGAARTPGTPSPATLTPTTGVVSTPTGAAPTASASPTIVPTPATPTTGTPATTTIVPSTGATPATPTALMTPTTPAASATAPTTAPVAPTTTAAPTRPAGTPTRPTRTP